MRERFPDPEPTAAARQAARESMNNNIYLNSNSFDDDSTPNLFGIFSSLCDFLSKKKR